MAVKRFSELSEKTRDELPSGYKLVGVTGSGTQGRNINFNPWELRCPGLPAGYSLCSYVENVGNTHIDTGVPSSEKVGIQMTYQFLGHPTTDGAIIIGAGSAANNTRQWINDASVGSGSGLCVGWGDSEPHGIASSNALAYGQVNFCMSHQATVNLPGAADLDLDDPTGGFSGWNLYLFACNGSASGAPVSPTHSKLYRCRLSVGWDVVRDFFPVVRDSDNKFGLFDAIEEKVYFPKAGSLTGERLSNVWDYSHFSGNEGAYIDDYPTPDSTNFVRAAGVEAGMEQIREAVILGNTPYSYYIKKNRISKSFKTLAPNAILQNCVWYNWSKFNMQNAFPVGDDENIVANENEDVSTAFCASTNAQRRSLFLGSPPTANHKFKSYYLSLYNFLNRSNNYYTGHYLSIYSKNCDYVIRIAGTTINRVLCYLFENANYTPGGVQTKKNTTVRYLADNATAYDQASTRILTPCAQPLCKTNAYIPLITSKLVLNTTYNNSSYYYAPSLSASTGFSDGKSLQFGLNTLLTSGTITKSVQTQAIVKFLNYIGRQPSTTTNNVISIGLKASIFDKIITTEASTSSTGTTYSTTYNENGRIVKVDKVVTDGTTKTTTTYTLNDSDEANMFRDALWNTNGVNGTSTGLLNGKKQVGSNIGQAFVRYWAIDIIPIE